MMQDDPKKSEDALPAPVPGSPGKQSGSGADAALNEMKKRQAGRHADNEPAGSGKSPDSTRTQP